MIPNKSVRKFHRKLERDYNALFFKYRDKIRDVIKEGKSTEFLKESSIEDIKEMCANHIANLTSVFLDKEAEMVQEFKAIEVLKELIEKKSPLANLRFLEPFFQKYNLTEQEQVEVMAYFIRICIEAVYEQENAYLKDMGFSSIFDKGAALAIDESVKVEIDQNKEELEARGVADLTTSEFFLAYHNLAHYILENGIINASNLTAPFYNNIMKTAIVASEYQIMLIIKEINNKYIIEQERKENEKLALQDLKSIVPMPELSLNDLQAKKQEKTDKWLATQKLKEFIVDGEPIKFVDDNDLKELIRLLTILEYSDKEINRIKKTILENNDLLIRESFEKKFLNAKLMLPECDRNLLCDAEEILSNKDALHNPIYDDINSSYALVKEMLIKIIYDNQSDERNEDIELYFMALKELREALNNYRLSDYRYVLVHKIKEAKIYE